MAVFKLTQFIDRPVDEVFNTVIHLEDFPKWSPQNPTARRLSDGEIGEGSRFEMEIKGFGLVPQTLEEFDRNRRMRVVPHLKQIAGGHRFIFSDLGGRTLNLPWQGAAVARLLYRGAAVGLLTAIYREGEMPYAAETNFLAALADQAAMAAANARLLAAAREKVALEERQRLARDLHDSLSQSLYGIQLGAQMARERLDQDPAAAAPPIEHVLRLAEASQAQMRALIFELRPETLETEGLLAALKRQVDVLRTKQGISAQLTAHAEPELAVEVKQALFRIAQEALWNAVKHARPQQVEVRLEPDGNSVDLEIADDGVGFDPNGSFPGHLGLRSMHERAIGAGGSLEIVSASGRGTRVVVRVPSAPQSPPRRERKSQSVPRRTRRAA